MELKQVKLPPPPGLIGSLTRGFDAVANHVLVILPPVLLDLFLWLGPHLRVKSFLEPFVARFPSVADAFPTSLANVTMAQEAWMEFINRFNLFILLRTFPVGTNSLLSLQAPATTPLGNPVGLDAGAAAGIFGWTLLLIFLGWLMGALYYFWTSNVALKLEPHPLGKPVKQAVFLSLIWLGLLLVAGVPVLMLISLVTFLSPLLGQILLIGGALLLIWLAMPIFFSAHGVFALQLDAFRAILNSLRMVRFTLPNTSLFLLAFVLINQGLNFLWNTPTPNSWWMLVGIAGHAFVSTALLAASFIYYRDINAWLKVVFDQLQQQTRSAKA